MERYEGSGKYGAVSESMFEFSNIISDRRRISSEWRACKMDSFKKLFISSGDQDCVRIISIYFIPQVHYVHDFSFLRCMITYRKASCVYSMTAVFIYFVDNLVRWWSIHGTKHIWLKDVFACPSYTPFGIDGSSHHIFHLSFVWVCESNLVQLFSISKSRLFEVFIIFCVVDSFCGTICRRELRFL